MKFKCVYKNAKFPLKQYDCYEDKWDNNSMYCVYEKVNDNSSQKLNMSKAQFENFELVLKTNGWQEAA